jgi:microcin C transport system permease protein
MSGLLSWFRLSPVTRRRIARFVRIRRGFYSLLILVLALVAALFAELIANNRALVVYYEGQYYFPTYKRIDMATFGQTDDFGFDDLEADYRRLKVEWQGTANWLVMPPIPWNPIENDFSYDSPPPNPPDGRHLLGTDSQGRDVAARLLYGFRNCMFFSLCLTAVSLMIGATIGCLQGYLSGWFDLASQRFIEIWSCLPYLFVVITLAAVLGPSFTLLLIVTGLFNWIGYTYYMRTEVYREKAREYCLAARSLGASPLRVIFVHLLPNSLTPLVTLAPFGIVGGIFSLTALDYLGYGLPAPTASWGELLDQALTASNRDKLWLSLSPFLAISITLTLVTTIGESIREAFDPREYSRYR